MKRAACTIFAVVSLSFGQSMRRTGEYALILEDPPLARKVASRAEFHTPAADAHLARVRTAQRTVLNELRRRGLHVNTTDQILLNAIFVSAGRESVDELKSIPGVARVVWLPRLKRHLNKALDLENVSAAWSAVGGASNAGAGIKIGIIDTGIDQNHPGFQDSSLRPPSGFPKGDSGFTNNKVIVARSYVSMLTGSDDPANDRPDDLSPRDRVGHGTAIAMIAAGVQNAGPVATIQGVAPKAFLGNYKIYGSPGVNDFTLYSALNQALNDALQDGMDIVTLSLGEGDPAVYGALDVGICSSDPAEVCDVRAQAVEHAIASGMSVVVSAGNDGAYGAQYPTLNSIHTPGTAPAAITVGATTNSHILFQAVHVNGSGAPSALKNIQALFDDGPKPAAPITAPVRDVAQLQNDGLACQGLPGGSLAGAIALVQRGTCAFSDKIINAQNAGAVAVIIYQASGTDFIYSSLFAQNTGIPAVMIGNTDGKALKSYIASNSGVTVTLDPAFNEVGAAFNTMWGSSSRGPNIGNFASKKDFALKPEVAAVGTDLYTATQKFDPNGDAYHASGYTTVTGTSFAVPMVAGAAAIAKQKNSALNSPGKLKSAVVNTATQDVTDNGAPASVTAMGAGKLNAGDAVNAAATLEPAAVSFGAIAAGSLPVNRTIVVTNVSGAAATFNFAVRQTTADNLARVSVSPASLPLQAGASNTVTITLQGSRPNPGLYEGFVEVTGGGRPALHLPYLYVVGDGVPYNAFPLASGGFLTAPSIQYWPIGFKVVDRYGVPVANTPVQFNLAPGAAISIDPNDPSHQRRLFDPQTDILGIAFANVDLGPQLGDQIFGATAGNTSVQFDGYARPYPQINANGVVNAASFQTGQGFAPGSYVSIFGTALADAIQVESTQSLPLSLSTVSVSFDDGGVSVPGRIHFVKPGQVNVQIPWEFQGHSSVQMKVSVGDLSSALYNVPLAQYSPGIFEYDDNGRQSAAVEDVDYKVIGQSHPARRGQIIQVFVNGLGPIDNQPASGEPSPFTNTKVMPTMKIGGVNAPVQFSGMTPGVVGLYQVNVMVANDTPTGLQPMVLTINGIDSKPANLPVQ